MCRCGTITVAVLTVPCWTANWMRTWKQPKSLIHKTFYCKKRSGLLHTHTHEAAKVFQTPCKADCIQPCLLFCSWKRGCKQLTGYSCVQVDGSFPELSTAQPSTSFSSPLPLNNTRYGSINRFSEDTINEVCLQAFQEPCTCKPAACLEVKTKRT